MLDVAKLFFWLSPPVESGSGVGFGIRWFQPLPIAVVGNRTVVLITKFSVNHHWINYGKDNFILVKGCADHVRCNWTFKECYVKKSHISYIRWLEYEFLIRDNSHLTSHFRKLELKLIFNSKIILTSLQDIVSYLLSDYSQYLYLCTKSNNVECECVKKFHVKYKITWIWIYK
jgi:hypothetical protein